MRFSRACEWNVTSFMEDPFEPTNGTKNPGVALIADAARTAPGFTLVLKCHIVPQFVIEREIPGAGALSESELREVSLRSLQVLTKMGPQIQWLHSYVTEDKVYCVYLAPDEDTVREHARKVGIPADRVSAVRRMIEPANLK
jgi:hypothetical protein